MERFCLVVLALTVKAPQGYDYAAEMARLGHASVIIDRLGYGSSPQPISFATCLGAQAAMAHQVVKHLGEGSYRADGIKPVTFSRVALGAHSAGGGIAEVAAYSYEGWMRSSRMPIRDSPRGRRTKRCRRQR